MEKMTYRELTAVLASLGQRLDAMDTFLTGVVALLGRDEVLQAARDHADAEQKRVDEMLTAQVEDGVKAGWLKPVKVSGLKTLVVGEEINSQFPDRTTRMQLVPEGIQPKDRGNYMGREVGEEFVVGAPGGAKIRTKITGVFEIDDARRRAVIAEAQAAAG